MNLCYNINSVEIIHFFLLTFGFPYQKSPHIYILHFQVPTFYVVFIALTIITLATFLPYMYMTYYF